jgi:hypothetical protein
LSTEIQTDPVADTVDELKFPLPPARPNGREASARQVIRTWAVADEKAHRARRNNHYSEPMQTAVIERAVRAFEGRR